MMRVIDIRDNVGPAEALFFTEIARPKPKPNEALVRVKAFGINRGDIMQRDGEYPVPPNAGRILGLEFAGVIAEMGDGNDNDASFKVGDQVFGLVYGGAYAEFVTVWTGMLIHKPSHLSWEECAGIPETWLTALKVMYEIGEFAAGKSILWHAGASGVSVSGIQLSLAAGASAVYATTRSQTKSEFCKQTLGCTAVFNTSEPDWADQVKRATDGRGVDIIVDLIGPAVFPDNLAIGAKDARIVLIGLMSGFKLRRETDLGLLVFKRMRFEGSTLRSRDAAFQQRLKDHFVKYAFSKFEQGEFKVYVHKVLPWEQIVDAHKLMESNAVTGKIVCTIP